MKVIYSEFDFYRDEKYQLIKKLYRDEDNIFWRVEANKHSKEYFQSLKELKNFPDSQTLEIKDSYIDFKYETSYEQFKTASTPELFKDFVQRNFQTLCTDSYDFSGCKYLSGLSLGKDTLLVMNTYLTLNPSQIFRQKSKFVLKSIFEFPCAAVPFDLLNSGAFFNGIVAPETEFKGFEKTLAYRICRYNYFNKYAKDRQEFKRI